MDNKLIKQLQETVLFEEDLFPSTPKEDVLNRKLTGIRQRHEEYLRTEEQELRDEEQRLRDEEEQRERLASKIEEVRVGAEKLNQAYIEKRKQVGIVGDKEHFKIPDTWVVDIRGAVYSQSPDLNNLPVEVTSEVITFAGRGIKIVLVCDVEDAFELPYREVSIPYDLNRLERASSIEEYLRKTVRFSLSELRVYFRGTLSYSVPQKGTKVRDIGFYYYLFTHTVDLELADEFEELKKKVIRGPLKREQISIFRDIRKAAVERDYKTIQDLVAKLGTYYNGQ